MICGFNNTKIDKGGMQDGIIHPVEESIDGESTANRTIDSAASVESFVSVDTLPARASVQPRLSYLDHSYLVWR